MTRRQKQQLITLRKRFAKACNASIRALGELVAARKRGVPMDRAADREAMRQAREAVRVSKRIRKLRKLEIEGARSGR